MSKKQKTVYICSECGYQAPRWLGKCPQCSTWDSLNEELVSTGKKAGAVKQNAVKLTPLLEGKPKAVRRFKCGIDELDSVLGGGIVPGSMVMIGGDPGIGKSTIMLQMLDKLKTDAPKIYVSGEESFEQIQRRALRLKMQDTGISFMNETDLDTILAALEKHKPAAAIIDSIQTISSDMVDGIPGNVSQLRFAAGRLMQTAKQNNITVFLVGHVTKDGAIAGPKILEHLVDTVLYFEGEQKADFRIIRAVKNRFGPVNEIAIFQMEQNGLIPVSNPSALFLDLERSDRQGTAVVSVLEGRRPVLVEVQALVSKTQFGMPQRTAAGIEHRRMNLLLAVLEKKCGKPFGFYDVFLKTAGGLRIDEPAADLGICMALISSMDDQNAAARTVYVAEVGLSGELRTVSQMQERINEAEKLGFDEIFIANGRKSLTSAKAELRTFDKIQDLVQ